MRTIRDLATHGRRVVSCACDFNVPIDVTGTIGDEHAHPFRRCRRFTLRARPRRHRDPGVAPRAGPRAR